MIRLFRVRTQEGNHYHVVQSTKGLACDCPDFTFRADYDPSLVGRGCNDIVGVMAVGLLDDH